MNTENLVKLGFSQPEAELLMADERLKAHTVDTAKFKTKLSAGASAYGVAESEIRQVVLSYSPFAGVDHERVLTGLLEVYGKENEAAVKKALLSFPRFAGYDHARVVRGLLEVYGAENEAAVKKAVLTFPQFAGLDHGRVMRQLGRMGHMAGLEQEQVIEQIMKLPTLAGYSAKRYLAAFDVAGRLKDEGLLVPNGEMVKIFLNYRAKSPYVPGTARLRVSQARKLGIKAEPPLMDTMRAVLLHRKTA